MKSGAADLQIERGDDVSFKLVPSGLRASRAKLDTVWGALAEMRAEAFVTDAVAEPLVATPRVKITMTPIAKGRVAGVIRVGDVCPGNADDVVVVRDAPTRLTACAPKGILSGLATTEAELEDTHLFAAHEDEIAELRIETLAPPVSALELARKESGWREKAPAERDLSARTRTAPSALVRAIARAEGADPRKSDEPFEAKVRVTVRRAEGGVAEVVELGAPDAAGDVIVRRAFDGARLHVAVAVARRLVPRAVALRGREVWAPRIEGAPVSAIEARCDGVEEQVTHDGDGWTMELPKGFAVDNASVLDLIDAVTRARVESWVADADDGHFGFAPPRASSRSRSPTDGGERVARVELGRAGEGGVYARTSDSPGDLRRPRGASRARARLARGPPRLRPRQRRRRDPRARR